ncbi:hypothetical protein PF008_g12044 [Phytophthora fragariae]|uniref:PAS domain-containing protein n=1 Tax=Phytophthora fragariae TaxID=53985 RepID=A0A6G0RQG8_9STRA|nr:hypothetical protein PF003_g26544 [Phytophthora fragariae]KAE9338482.1 hypothetical protein PF008_g12044 [Phytophthora fragariae]
MMQASAIIDLDKEGEITVWSTTTASMTGYASVDMVSELLLPVVDGGLTKIAGSRVEIVLCLTPRFETIGSVMGVVAIGQDVTERNTKEMEYRKLIQTANAPIFGVGHQSSTD